MNTNFGYIALFSTRSASYFMYFCQEYTSGRSTHNSFPLSFSSIRIFVLI